MEDLVLTYAFFEFDWDMPVVIDPVIFDTNTTLPVVELTRLKYLKLVRNLEPCTQFFYQPASRDFLRLAGWTFNVKILELTTVIGTWCLNFNANSVLGEMVVATQWNQYAFQ